VKKFRLKPLIMPSLLVLVLANLIPVVGILFFGWSQDQVLLLYWSESAVIGVYTLLKMAFSKGVSVDKKVMRLLKPFLMVFFIVHFGFFMYGHLDFLIFFALHLSNPSLGGALPLVYGVLPWLLLLFLSHGFSFVTNFMAKGEYKTATAASLFFAPYPRIFIMQVAIIFGAIFGLSGIILVLGKTVLDAYAHVKEHKEIFWIKN